jgi:hypothetical protein
MQRDFDRWLQDCGRAPAPASTACVMVINSIAPSGCTRAEVLAALAAAQARVFGRHPAHRPLSLADLGNLEGMRSADLAGAWQLVNTMGRLWFP